MDGRKFEDKNFLLDGLKRQNYFLLFFISIIIDAVLSVKNDLNTIF